MATSKLTGKRLQYALAITGALAWVLQGYDQALMNGLLALEAFQHAFPPIHNSRDHSLLQGTVVALLQVGAALGGVMCFLVGDILGRKRTTMLAAVIVLVGTVIQASSFQTAQLIVGRLVTGVGIGSFTATIPTWVGESTGAKERGWFVMLECCGAMFGLAFVGWVEFGFFFGSENSVSWRFPIAFQAVFPIAVLVLCCFLRESPRWLMSKDRHEAAARVLTDLAGENEDPDLIQHQARIIHDSILADQQAATKNPFARTNNRYLHRTLLAVAVSVLAKMAGSSVITFYSNIVLEQTLGYSALNARVISNCLQTWHFLWSFVGMALIDRVGRRPLLIVCAGLMAGSLAGLAGLSSIDGNKAAAGCILIFYFITLAVYPVGLFLTPFMYASEIAPPCVRSRVAAIASCMTWLTDFWIAETSPTAFANIGWKYYLVYVCTNILSVAVFYCFVPETKGRSLEEIDTIFVMTDSAWNTVRIARNLGPLIDEDLDLPSKAPVTSEHKEYIEYQKPQETPAKEENDVAGHGL
ncbi:hypothetical protein B7463_g559, partial [Scytalidium lignicola]